MNDFEFQRSAESNKDVKLSKRCQISQISKKYFYRYHTSMNNNVNQNVLIDNKVLIYFMRSFLFSFLLNKITLACII